MVKQQEHQPINDEYHLFIKNRQSIIQTQQNIFFFQNLERISCVGNEVDEPHFVSDHVVQSPTIKPVNIVTNKPIASVFKPTFHKVESSIHKPKTIPNIGPYYSKKSFGKKTFLNIFIILPSMEILTSKPRVF